MQQWAIKYYEQPDYVVECVDNLEFMRYLPNARHEADCHFAAV